MSLLRLPLKAEYFDAIKAGAKPTEYRLATPYWRKRLVGKHYEGIELMRGYPKASDRSRRLRRPWRGYTCTTIQHPQFGDSPVMVYAIPVHP